MLLLSYPLSTSSSLPSVRSIILPAILFACLRALTVMLSALCLLHQTDPPADHGGTAEVPSASASANAPEQGAAESDNKEGYDGAEQ
eukprot:1962889-Pleurochrysis_carterae.AAC.1